MTTSSEAPVAPVKAGDLLAGKYEVERVLGFGGMGVVVAARHIHLGERVAIKFLLPQAMAKVEVVQRFVREGRAAVRIKSEHVARVFDVGTLDGGAPYMVMEFLEGEDLSALLRRDGALPIGLAVEYVLQACEAIAEAHSIGIIHRDLKPANLFLSKRADGSPVVKVIDFGISKVADPSAEGDVEMTKTDVMMGSPVYMAPEQMISARDVDQRADVFSLGVILYCLVTGDQPFKGNSVTQLYAAILEGPPSLRAARPDAPASLDAAVTKCLQASAKLRFDNVAELAQAIADSAPAHARVSMERASRTLGVQARGSASSSPDGATGSAVVVAGTGAMAGSPTAATMAPAGAKGAVVATTGPHTEGSWGATQGPLQRRSRGKALAIGGVVAAALVAGGLFLLLRGGGAATGGSGAGPEAPITGAPGSNAGSGTTVTPAGTVNDGPGATASVSASASSSATSATSATNAASAGTAASSAGATGRLPATAKPTGTARPASSTTKSKGDLFSDPH